jgi:hypothetical protein
MGSSVRYGSGDSAAEVSGFSCCVAVINVKSIVLLYASVEIRDERIEKSSGVKFFIGKSDCSHGSF